MIRTIYIYLYRLNDEPIYVGQTPDIVKRDRAHVKNVKGSSFERLLAQVSREKFTLEVVCQIEDLPHGAKANALENRIMDEFGTYRPGEPGRNQSRAGIGNHQTEERYKAARASQRAAMKEVCSREGVREKMSDRQKKVQTPAHRAHLSEILKGRSKPKGFGEANRRPENRARVSAQFLGKSKSEKTRIRMSRFHQVKNGFEFFDCWESQHLLAPAA